MAELFIVYYCLQIYHKTYMGTRKNRLVNLAIIVPEHLYTMQITCLSLVYLQLKIRGNYVVIYENRYIFLNTYAVVAVLESPHSVDCRKR